MLLNKLEVELVLRRINMMRWADHDRSKQFHFITADDMRLNALNYNLDGDVLIYVSPEGICASSQAYIDRIRRQNLSWFIDRVHQSQVSKKFSFCLEEHKLNSANGRMMITISHQEKHAIVNVSRFLGSLVANGIRKNQYDEYYLIAEEGIEPW